MRRLRARLVIVSLALLLMQVAAAVSSLAACCADAPKPEVMECCRGGDTDHICPTKTKSGEAGCRLRAGCENEDRAGLLAATAWMGDVATGMEIALLPPLSAVPSWSPDSVSTWIQLPPTPPPRG